MVELAICLSAAVAVAVIFLGLHLLATVRTSDRRCREQTEKLVRELGFIRQALAFAAPEARGTQLPPPPVMAPARRSTLQPLEAPPLRDKLRRVTPTEVRRARQAWAVGRAPAEIEIKPKVDLAEVAAHRYEAVVKASEEAGRKATHCESTYCFRGHPDVDVCTCDCAACIRAGELLLMVQEEAQGRKPSKG